MTRRLWLTRLEPEVRALASEGSRVAEGAFITWTRPFFDAAEAVVWLGIGWRSARYRTLKRHFLAELRRDNRFPGWRAMLRFWLWSRRYYADRNLADFNEWGTAARRGGLQPFLTDCDSKLHVCRSDGDLEKILAKLRG